MYLPLYIRSSSLCPYSVNDVSLDGKQREIADGALQSLLQRKPTQTLGMREGWEFAPQLASHGKLWSQLTLCLGHFHYLQANFPRETLA